MEELTHTHTAPLQCHAEMTALGLTHMMEVYLILSAQLFYKETQTCGDVIRSTRLCRHVIYGTVYCTATVRCIQFGVNYHPRRLVLTREACWIKTLSCLFLSNLTHKPHSGPGRVSFVVLYNNVFPSQRTS